MTLNDIGSRRNGGLLVIGFTTDESTANKIPEYISSSEKLVSSYLELQSYLEIQPPSFPGFSARYQKKRTTRMCVIRDELNTRKESGSVKKKRNVQSHVALSLHILLVQHESNKRFVLFIRDNITSLHQVHATIIRTWSRQTTP